MNRVNFSRRLDNFPRVQNYAYGIASNLKLSQLTLSNNIYYRVFILYGNYINLRQVRDQDE